MAMTTKPPTRTKNSNAKKFGRLPILIEYVGGMMKYQEHSMPEMSEKVPALRPQINVVAMIAGNIVMNCTP